MSEPFAGQPVPPLPPLGSASGPSSSRPTTAEPPSVLAHRNPESPVALILVGFFVGAVLGGCLILAGAASDVGLMVLLGYILVVAGSVITSVGIVAAGVRLGMRWAKIDSSL